MRARAPASIFAVLLGIFFLIMGVWGLFSPVVFGAFTTNKLHAIIHIVLGFLGVSLGIRDRAREYCVAVGIAVLAVGVLRLVPETSPYIREWLAVNRSGAYVNIAIGAGALIFAMIPRPRPMGRVHVHRRRLITNV